MHRTLVDTIAQQTGVELHPWEIAGWIPHTTVLRLKPELQSGGGEILATTRMALSPLPLFKAQVLRMYRLDRAEGQWQKIDDFPLGS